MGSPNYFGNFDLSKPLIKPRKKGMLIDDEYDAFDLSGKHPDQPNSNSEEVIAKPGKYSNDEFPTTATDEYLEHLRNVPRKEDYKSSTGRKIGGLALAALTGSDFGVIDAPYRNALQKFKEEGFGLKEGALIEQKGNVEQRRRLKDVYNKAKADREYNRKVQDANERNQRTLERLQLIKDDNERKKAIADHVVEWHHELRDMKREHDDRVSIPLLNVAQRNAATREASLADRQNRPLPAREQQAISAAARESVLSDNRFAKFWDPTVKRFASKRFKLDANGQKIIGPDGQPIVIEEMDDTTKNLLKRALVEAESKIASRKRRMYDVDAMDESDIDNYLGGLGFGSDEDDDGLLPLP